MTSKTQHRSFEKPYLLNPLVKEPGDLVTQMRGIAVQALRDMYRPKEGQFVFRKKKGPGGIIYEGLSLRYTAITLIALAGEKEDVAQTILSGQSLKSVCRRLERSVSAFSNAGDVALTLWACHASGLSDRGRIRGLLRDLLERGGGRPTVETAWALKAFCVDCDAGVGDLRKRLAERLISSFNPKAGIFSHFTENGQSLRDHVSCFADQVYPIQALSGYHLWSSNKMALEMASRCAEKISEHQGAGGQWWWHYDRRTGRVVEEYPVYSVHQDAMAPMALRELHRAGGRDFSKAIGKGLAWMQHVPEIGDSLMDAADVAIWRKVDRKGPRKFSRYLKASAVRLHKSFRVHWIDRLLPPVVVDYECRPYHFGWLLYAWPIT